MNALLIAAIIAVESNGNDMAIGDNGKARGPLQIHKELVQDVNRFAGTHYEWSRMTNRTEAVAVFKLYSEHYSKNASDETVARRWNGGPNGHKKHATLGYWQKVKAKMH